MKIQDVCDLFTDGDWIESKDQSECGIRLIQTGNIGVGKYLEKEGREKYISEETFTTLNCTEIYPGDVLVSRLPEPVGRGCIVPLKSERMITAVDCTICRVNENLVDKRYFCYYLQSTSYSKQLEKSVTGSTRKRISRKNLGNVEIHIPDRKKQLEIITVLDKISFVIDLREQQLQQLDELVKARFVELFGLPVSNSMNLETEKMQSIAPSQNYLGEMPTKVWLLNLDMVESQTGRIIEYLIVPKDEVGNSTCVFDDSTVLYSKLRPYLNKVVIPDRCGYATSELIPLKPNTSKINREYLAYMLRSDEFVSMISEKVAGAKMPRVSMGDFRNFDVPVPPKELQNEFANFVKQTDKSKFVVQKALDEAQTLFDSLMQEYFG